MIPQSDQDQFIQKAMELGAVEAKIIDPETVVFAAWVRLKCQFGCPYYGTRYYCCPPHTPTLEEMKEIVACYSTALLFHSQGMEVQPLVVARQLEHAIFLHGYHKAFGLGAGPCWLCKQCNPEQCVHPLEARPSMEACGIDVFGTARIHGFEINVVRERTEIPNRYGLVLIV